MTRLKILMRRIKMIIFSTNGAASDLTAPIRKDNHSDETLFQIHRKSIWSDDVAAPVRGGRRYREAERFGTSQGSVLEDESLTETKPQLNLQEKGDYEKTDRLAD